MKKSVYSLVLSDDVIKAVDEAAYAAGLSRSAYINGVLAKAVSYVTPEERISDIFGCIERLMDISPFRITRTASDTMLSIRSAMQYRYKPVIRYCVELFRGGGSRIGQLRVSLRTQSQRLYCEFSDFIALWTELEKKYIAECFPDGIEYTLDSGRFGRTLSLTAEKRTLSDEDTARAVSEYIKVFDGVMKTYFADIEDRQTACAAAEEKYRQLLSEQNIII